MAPITTDEEHYSSPSPPALIQGVRLDFKDICMSVQTKHGRKQILTQLTGHVTPGRLTALLGPSGSGKTSLLNVLAARTSASKGLLLTGTMRVDGQLVENWQKYRQQVAYVEQDDLMFRTLTVRETLEFAAHLRLPRSMSTADKMLKVEEVMGELGLHKCEDTRIGSAARRGISGGERKRTSIALAILRSPTVLLLDEATSGLDSFAALKVANTMKSLAVKGGKTVITSIHQPRSSIFQLFDDLVVLGEGGRMMYRGKAGMEMLDYLESKFNLILPENFNPGDYILDVVSVDVRSAALEEESRKRVERIASEAKFLDCTVVEIANGEPIAVKEMEDATKFAAGGGGATMNKPKRTYEAPLYKEFILLARRAFVQKTRDPEVILPQFITAVLFGLVIGFIYFQNFENLHQNAIQDKAGLLFFVCLNQSFNGILIQLETFPQERDIVFRERTAKTYRIAPYFFSKTLADFPNLIFPFIFSSLVYWIAGMPANAVTYFRAVFLTLLVYFCAESFGLVCSAAMNTAESAQQLCMPFMLIFAIFSGFFAKQVTPVLSWIAYLSPIRWGYAALLQVTFADLEFICNPGQVGCLTNGQEYIAISGLEQDSFERSVGVLIGMAIGYQILGLCVLVLKRAHWAVPVDIPMETLSTYPTNETSTANGDELKVT